MLIGLTGKAGSGKTTACKYLQEKYPDLQLVNMKVAIIAEMRANFATLLEEIAHVYNIDSPTLWTVDRLFEDKPPLMRKLMQCYGGEVRRGDDPDYWVKQWKSFVSYTKGDIICDDVRFINEADAIKDMGGVVIRIVREDITDTGTHSTEAEMDKIEPDFTVIAKPGDLEGLYKQLEEVIHRQVVA
jgi:hypothetical protein